MVLTPFSDFPNATSAMEVSDLSGPLGKLAGSAFMGNNSNDETNMEGEPATHVTTSTMYMFLIIFGV